MFGIIYVGIHRFISSINACLYGCVHMPCRGLLVVEVLDDSNHVGQKHERPHANLDVIVLTEKNMLFFNASASFVSFDKIVQLPQQNRGVDMLI